MASDDGFDSVFRASYPSVMAYCLRRVPRPAAEDAVAEVFSIAWRRRSSVPAEPIPWLIGVARRVLANQGRAERRRRWLHVRAAEARPALPAETEMTRVQAAMARLSRLDAEIVTLVYWDGLTHEQIGDVVGLTANAVGVRLHRARARLKAELVRSSDEETAPCDTPT